MDGVVALACIPTQIAGRNRMWRRMIIDDIRADPDWHGGDYTSQPGACAPALQLLFTAGSAPLVQQRLGPSRDSADAYITRCSTLASRDRRERPDVPGGRVT